MATTLETSDEPRLNGHSAAGRNGKAESPLSHGTSQASFWRSSAPKELREHGADAVAAWTLRWANRQPPKSIAKLCDSASDPLAWSFDAERRTPPCKQLLELAAEIAVSAETRRGKGKLRKRLHCGLNDWLTFAKSAPAEMPLAATCLAAAQLLGAVGHAVEGRLAWDVLDFLVRTANHAQHWQMVDDTMPTSLPAQQVLAGELPLTLSYLFSEMEPLHSLRLTARGQLSDALSELLNGRGLPRGPHIGALRALLACWTRCRAIGEQLKGSCWSDKADRQYQWLVRQALRWTAGDGSPLLSETAQPISRDLVRAALAFGRDRKDAAAAKKLLGKKAAGGSPTTGEKSPARSDNCEWSCLAVMRSDWSPRASIVAIDYSRPEMQLEAWADGRQIFRGAWKIEPQLNGNALKPVGAWEELCWLSDKDVDYLELSLELTDDAKLERQIVHARRGGFVLLVDHLKTSAAGNLKHTWQLPYNSGLHFSGEHETRDAILFDGEPLVRLLPLALPEWRTDPRGGELTGDGSLVKLSQHAVGTSLACPLFVDLRRRRVTKPSTWRQLTVAEALQIQPPDVAVAYRVQCGKQQWAYYRSQGQVGNRTFLGQNTSSESMVARFLPKTGGIETLVEIEGSA